MRRLTQAFNADENTATSTGHQDLRSGRPGREHQRADVGRCMAMTRATSPSRRTPTGTGSSRSGTYPTLRCRSTTTPMNDVRRPFVRVKDNGIPATAARAIRCTTRSCVQVTVTGRERDAGGQRRQRDARIRGDRVRCPRRRPQRCGLTSSPPTRPPTMTTATTPTYRPSHGT